MDEETFKRALTVHIRGVKPITGTTNVELTLEFEGKTTTVVSPADGLVTEESERALTLAYEELGLYGRPTAFSAP